MKKLLFISLFAALLAVGCDGDNELDEFENNSQIPNEDFFNPSNPNNEQIPSNEIHYTSTDKKPIDFYNYKLDDIKDASEKSATVVSNEYYYDDDDDNLSYGILKFDRPIVTIGEYVFSDYLKLESITIPEGVTSIGKCAFEDCTNLICISLPQSLTELKAYCFDGCRSLYGISLPDNLKSISHRVFHRCERITYFIIPDKVKEFGENPFFYCPNLTAFYGIYASKDKRCLIDKNGKLISLAQSGLTEYNIPDDITSIGHSALRECTGLKKITIPNSVTHIGAYAFYGNKITDINIPENVTVIEECAFEICTNLTNITIPDKVKDIEINSFYGCRDLKEVNIGKGVTAINGGAFENCTSLTSITIPDNVKKVSSLAFSNCDNLKTWYIQPTTPPEDLPRAISNALGIDAIDANIVEILNNLKIYVPNESLEVYQKAFDMSKLLNSIIGYDFK